jgi:hypothetical protein
MIPHPFINPFTGKLINETDEENKQRFKEANLKAFSITFINSKPFGFQKTQKMGRVKRKVRRKVMRANNI